MKLIDLIVGARPNFMKVAPIINAINKDKNKNLSYRLIHTGQHYSKELSDTFFEQLNIPFPDINLEVGSGTQAYQTGLIMQKYESVLINKKPDLCLVVGDVNSTMACAISSQKIGIPVAHVEAGIRSNDWSMPEEINRLVTDSISNWFFTTSEFANDNLRKEGVDDNRIFFVGNTMIDTLNANLHNLKKPKFFKKLCLKNKNYFVLTLHRPSNVDDVNQLQTLIEKIASGVKELPIIFPAHPRTTKIISQEINLPSNIYLVEPQPYLEFNFIVKNAKAVITDSGGITEEATVMGVPCMTLRENTERPETISIGTNELIGNDSDKMNKALDKLFKGNWKKGDIPYLWDGMSGKRIVDHLEKILCT